MDIYKLTRVRLALLEVFGSGVFSNKESKKSIHKSDSVEPITCSNTPHLPRDT